MSDENKFVDRSTDSQVALVWYISPYSIRQTELYYLAKEAPINSRAKDYLLLPLCSPIVPCTLP